MQHLLQDSESSINTNDKNITHISCSSTMHTETAQSWDSLLRWSVYCQLPSCSEAWYLLSNKPAESLSSSSLPSPMCFSLLHRELLQQDAGMGVSSMLQVCCLSFTGQFTVKAGESNSKGLKSTERIIIVQSEHIFCYTTKLHHNVVSWGEKKDSEMNNFTVKQRKKNPKPTTNKKPTRLAVPNICGWCIHPFSPEWP